MMVYKTKILFFCLILFTLLLYGCKKEEKLLEYESKEHSFSFLYPDSFKEADKEEDKFAFLDKEDNAILFIINENPSTNEIMELGKEQAYKDLSTQLTSKEEIDKQVKIVRTKKMGWYTYAIDFPSKNVKSIVSGTLCDGKEVTIVLVTKDKAYEENKQKYIRIIESFECR